MLDTHKVNLGIKERSPMAALIGRVSVSTLRPGHEVGSEEKSS